MAVTVDVTTSDEDICAACPEVYNTMFQPKVTLICKQKESDPTQIIIKLVLSRDKYFEIDRLAQMGYTQGPMESHEFHMCDYEKLRLTFKRNIGCHINDTILNPSCGEEYRLTFRVGK